MDKTFIIGEIGINHNGNLKIAKELIDWAVLSGADAVKFQKRTIEKVYTKEWTVIFFKHINSNINLIHRTHTSGYKGVTMLLCCCNGGIFY